MGDIIVSNSSYIYLSMEGPEYQNSWGNNAVSPSLDEGSTAGELTGEASGDQNHHDDDLGFGDDSEFDDELQKYALVFTQSTWSPEAPEENARAEPSSLQPTEEQDNVNENSKVDSCQDRSDSIAALKTFPLSRRSWNMKRRWSSTSNIYETQNQRNNHYRLKPEVSSLLELSVEVNEEEMEWRNHCLNELWEMLKHIPTDCTTDYVHPLQEGTTGEQQECSRQTSEDTGSHISTDSSHSSRSTHSRRQQWFRLASRLSLRRKPPDMVEDMGRRFIDLTAVEGLVDDSDGDEGAVYESVKKEKPHRLTHRTCFTIPILVKKDEESLVKRSFLDLTVSRREDSETHDKERDASSSLCRVTKLVDNSKDHYGGESEEFSQSLDDITVDDDSFNGECSWERADSEFIGEVHEIAVTLEQVLQSQGFDSPFFPTSNIIPAFNELHVKIEENIKFQKMEHCKSKNGEPIESPKGCVDGFKEYLSKYLYDVRLDNTCSLPSGSLAKGLEKELSQETTEIALEALSKLISPLRMRR
jgi:hypothetical protein